MFRYPRQSAVASPREQLEYWYQRSTAGRRLRSQVAEDMAVILDEWFGYHILVVGVDSGIDVQQMTRVQHLTHIVAARKPDMKAGATVLAEDEELPIDTESIDVVVLLNALELSRSPHRVLREVHRVLTPHGHLLAGGSNPLSLRGVGDVLRRWIRGRRAVMRGLSVPKLQDWLHLLDFSVAPVRHKLVLPFGGPGRLGRWIMRLDNWLADHNIPSGSAYVMYANKTVAGHISNVRSQRTSSRLMGLPVAKPVVGAREAARRSRTRGSHLRSVD